MKNLLRVMGLFFIFLSFSVFAQERTYGLHLFFDEKEFVDILTLTDEGGHMLVPHDFEGKISNFKQEGLHLSFELFVPKNSSRPVDLIFLYEGKFFDSSQNQIIGFVTIKGHSSFVASFVAFKR